MTLYVNQDAGFLAVALYAAQRPAGPDEVIEESLGHEVTSSGAGGAILLRPPDAGDAELAIHLVLSKPGFEVFSGRAGGWGSTAPSWRPGEQIELFPTATLGAEQRALRRWQTGVAGLRSACEAAITDDPTCRALWNHLDARQAFVETTYPFAVDAALAAQPRPLAHGRVRVSAWCKMRHAPDAEIIAARALPGDGLAVLETTPEQAALVRLEGSEPPAEIEPLPEAGAALALARGPDRGLALLAGDTVRTWDDRGELRGTLTLSPPPGLGEVVVSLAPDPRGGWVVGSRRPDANWARLYDADGRLRQAWRLPGVRRLDRLWVAPDGALVALGDLGGAYRNAIELAGVHDHGLPRGLIRFAELTAGAEGERLLEGIDSAAFGTDGGWAWLSGYASAEASAAARAAGPRPPWAQAQRQVLVPITWTGELGEPREVTDPELAGLDVALEEITSEGTLLLRARGDSIGLGVDLFELTP